MKQQLTTSDETDIFVFPESCLSGYLLEKKELKDLNVNVIDDYVGQIIAIAESRNLIVWFGSITKEDGKYYNTGIGVDSEGIVKRYHKVNLANLERKNFSSGNKLPVFSHFIRDKELIIGIQLCRELKFPEQWRELSRKGAEVILHMNNAIEDEGEFDVWRSQLISRAAENQRYVISVNAADANQKSPSIAINPKGDILSETKSGEIVVDSFIIDSNHISNMYLNQIRDDVLE